MLTVLRRGKAESMTTRRARDESGVVAVNLVLVLAFALFAVIMLTRTTVAASQIDDRVKKIRGEVGSVDEELNNVSLLDQTSATAAQIDTATRNLSRQAGEIVTLAKSIDRTVQGILSNATSINLTVGSIGGTVRSIQPTVRAIDAGVAGINARVARVRFHVHGSANSIKSDTGQVLAHVGPGHGSPLGGTSIHGHANSIDCRLRLVGSTACGQ